MFLCNNYFKKLTESIFEGLHNVTRIHMFENKYLDQIGPDLFKGNLNKLEKIDLGRSALESIDLDMFKCVPNLKCLVIRSGYSKLLNYDFIENLRKSGKYSFDIC